MSDNGIHSLFSTPDYGWRRVLHKIWFTALILIALGSAACAINGLFHDLQDSLETAFAVAGFAIGWIALRAWLGWLSR